MKLPFDDRTVAEVDAMITLRILAYHQGLIDGGQIREFEIKGPSASPLVSDCSHLEHKHKPHDLSGDPAPPLCAPAQQVACGSEHE